jgi:hypothetical protein
MMDDEPIILGVAVNDGRKELPRTKLSCRAVSLSVDSDGIGGGTSRCPRARLAILRTRATGWNTIFPCARARGSAPAITCYEFA